MPGLQVRQFPCLHDNYGFLAHCPQTGETAAIDTPDPAVILQQAEAAGWRVTQIWNTHHHADHAGGNLALKEATGARIVAPAADRHRIPGVDRGVEDGERAALGACEADVIATPGHTTGHVIYHFAADKVLFVGDTLFAMGCGRLFEGTAHVMWHSLNRLRAMPDDTTVYCAHEYTQANARFALSVDPQNAALKARAAEVDTARAAGRPTVPTTLGEERATNPFLRAKDAENFARLRAAKDVF